MVPSPAICSGLAVDLLQSSPFMRRRAIEAGLLESVAGKVMPTALGAEKLSENGKPLEMLGIEFDDVSKFKKALMIAKRLLEHEPTLTNEELRDRTHKALEKQ